MGLFSKDIKSLDDLFVHQLQDIYYAEHQITKALPKMIEGHRPAAAQWLRSPPQGDTKSDYAARAGLQNARTHAEGRGLPGSRWAREGGERSCRRGGGQGHA